MEQKWGSAALLQTRAYSKDKGWWGRKRSLLKCYTIWGSWTLPHSRLLFSAKHRKKPFVPKKTETQNRFQQSRSILIYSFWSLSLLSRWISVLRLRPGNWAHHQHHTLVFCVRHRGGGVQCPDQGPLVCKHSGPQQDEWGKDKGACFSLPSF